MVLSNNRQAKKKTGRKVNPERNNADKPNKTKIASKSTSRRTRTRKSTKPRVHLLLPIWGNNFILQFTSLGLPSLLAKGNLPDFSKKYDCVFVFLTLEENVEFLERQKILGKLKKYCDVEYYFIDHLVIEGNYSTVITLSYAEAMLSCGAKMCETYFIYLVADYIFSDGSFRGISKYIEQGYSGLLAGNFQATQEDIWHLLEGRIDKDVLTIEPRELVKLGLNNLHPVSEANTVNSKLKIHSVHSNRLLWRIDDSLLVGRFFLLHMLCIKPERDDFKIGSSCDYSFIPEMCPSGNITVIDDSDDYFVLETQPRGHEADFLELGPVNQEVLINCLNEFSTDQHRKNSQTMVLFHSEEKPDDLSAAYRKTGQFVDELIKRLHKKPQPYRCHHYWLGAVQDHWKKTSKKFENLIDWKENTWEKKLVMPTSYSTQVEIRPEKFVCPKIYERIEGFGPKSWLSNSPAPIFSQFFRTIIRVILGDIPEYSKIHPRYRDYICVKENISRALAGDANKDILIISGQASPVTSWASRQSARIKIIDTMSCLMQVKSDEKMYDLIIISLLPVELRSLESLVEIFRLRLKSGSSILIHIVNDQPVINKFNVALDVKLRLARHTARHLEEVFMKVTGGKKYLSNLRGWRQVRLDFSSGHMRHLLLGIPKALYIITSILVYNTTRTYIPQDQITGHTGSILIELKTPK